jgi:hypothetical protein
MRIIQRECLRSNLKFKMEKDSSDFDALLSRTWEAYFERTKTAEQPTLFHEQSELRELNQRGVIAFYNKLHV